MRKLPWPSTSLGMHLQQARNACQCTQRTLAQQAHVSPPTLRLLEHGQGNLTSFWAVLHTLNLDIVGRNLPPGPHIGERILTWRQRKGMSQRELSQFVGVSPPTLLALERHGTGRVPTLERVLVALGAGASLVASTLIRAHRPADGLPLCEHKSTIRRTMMDYRFPGLVVCFAIRPMDGVSHDGRRRRTRRWNKATLRWS